MTTITQKKQEDGTPVTAGKPRVGQGLTTATFDFGCKETWYSQSVLVEDEVLSDSGDGLTFNSVNTHWIDVVSGKCLRQEALMSTYQEVVKVDGAVMTPRYYFADSGGDYEIDYVTGAITFFTNQAGKVVTATYHYADGQWWELGPPDAGKKIVIEEVEMQFSVDTVMTDALDMRVLMNHAQYGWIVVETVSYESIRQIMAEARGTYPVIPAVGGSSRGLSMQTLTFPFRYLMTRELLSSLQLKLQVGSRNGVPMDGEMATCTFYCTIEEE